MDEIKERLDAEVCIRDLKYLGLFGGCIAILEGGQSVHLKAKFGTIDKPAIIAGKPVTVALKVSYQEIYKQIKLIKRKKLVIARKSKYKDTFLLLLTGKGYHRPFKK